ncbi:MAG: HAD-IA family hydrolase [Faecalicatena sp.]|uniref:HAD family hydrolase n=1 Tax=Faecalicatena sp. TaxID=2005360 RepID=UPI00258C5350|nr:HAD-IA family hydrolase [Faecalicatena sp.]MCI6465705.1 HAD-IA family hydrolase [Faecalicatena sp.]MDY5618020.1 HAD-IA family hydrolase [Lachnospiraceae bacterium]
MIQAVFFDIDDTLYHFTEANRLAASEVEIYVCKELKIESGAWKDAVKQAQLRIGARLGQSSPTTHNRQIRFQNALEILHKPIHPHGTKLYQLYWDTVLKNAVPEPGVERMLDLLKKKGIHLGIGSDMTSYIQNKKLEMLGLAPYFDSVVTSEEAGSDKPNSSIFQLCMEKAGCAPEECLFIGDNWEKDVAGACAVGMHCACYSRYSRPPGWGEEYCFNSYEDCIQGDRIRIGKLTI